MNQFPDWRETVKKKRKKRVEMKIVGNAYWKGEKGVATIRLFIYDVMLKPTNQLPPVYRNLPGHKDGIRVNFPHPEILSTNTMRLFLTHLIMMGLCSAATIPAFEPGQVAATPQKETANTVQNGNKPRARSLPPQMAILDHKRNPKPKRPIGNDIGTARELDISQPLFPNSAQPSRIPDHVETTISVGYTMTTANATSEESAQVSRELHEIIDAIPTMPATFVPNIQMQKDPEEEDLDRRIMQVARQLTETEIRKEYEAEKRKDSEAIQSPTTEEPNTESTEPSTIPTTTTTTVRTEKVGKSFILSNPLPLVSQLPPETAQLQLIAEFQEVPHYLVDEGFQPRTPAPELIGPLLGGPPLKPEDAEDERSGKSIGGSKYVPLGLPDFIKLIAPKYVFNPNDVVISIPVGSGLPVSMIGSQPRSN